MFVSRRKIAFAAAAACCLALAAADPQPTVMSIESLQISPAEWLEIGQAFTAVMQVIQKSGERRAAYLAKLKAQGIEEEPMSDAGVAFEINVLNNRFAFDKYGYLHFDDRFVKPEERPALQIFLVCGSTELANCVTHCLCVVVVVKRSFLLLTDSLHSLTCLKGNAGRGLET